MSKLVVTMTSWRDRIHNCHVVINQVLNNTLKPDAIYLNLSEEEFPKRDIPPHLLELDATNPIFHINWVPGPNTKPWKKVFPILQFLEDDDMIVLIDDDMDVQPILL